MKGLRIALSTSCMKDARVLLRSRNMQPTPVKAPPTCTRMMLPATMLSSSGVLSPSTKRPKPRTNCTLLFKGGRGGREGRWRREGVVSVKEGGRSLQLARTLLLLNKERGREGGRDGNKRMIRKSVCTCKHLPSLCPSVPPSSHLRASRRPPGRMSIKRTMWFVLLSMGGLMGRPSRRMGREMFRVRSTL